MKILSKSVLVILFTFVFRPLAAVAQTPAATTQLEPGINVSIDLSKRFGLVFNSGREKNEEQASGKWKVGAMANYRAKPLFKHFFDVLDTDKQHVVVLGAGYEYAHSTEQGITKNEHKIMLDATLRWGFKNKLLLSNRNRFEIRWVNSDAHFRIRERLKLERPLRVPMRNFKRKLTPFVVAEGFYDQRYKKFNVFRYGGGIETPLFPRTSLEVYYERMRCTTCVDPNTNVLTMNLNVYLRRKKK